MELICAMEHLVRIGKVTLIRTSSNHGYLTAGTYSSLSFTVNLKREIGFYLLDYYVPSMMIVAISWVSFWLQADASPPRIMLGKI